MVKLERHCISDVRAFFVANKLRCNPFKTEIVYFRSRFINLPPLAGIKISHRVVSTSKEVRNLRVVFDDHLTLSSHINYIVYQSICRSASLALLRNMGKVRKYLNQGKTERRPCPFLHYIKARLFAIVYCM